MVSKCFRVVIYELLIDFPNLGLAGLGLRETVGGPHSAFFSDKGAQQPGWTLPLWPCPEGSGGSGAGPERL